MLEIDVIQFELMSNVHLSRALTIALYKSRLIYEILNNYEKINLYF